MFRIVYDCWRHALTATIVGLIVGGLIAYLTLAERAVPVELWLLLGLLLGYYLSMIASERAAQLQRDRRTREGRIWSRDAQGSDWDAPTKRGRPRNREPWPWL